MPSREIILDIRLWKVLMGVLLVAFAFFLYRRTFPQLPARRRLVLGVLRAAAFALLALFVLDPSLVAVITDTSKPLVLALVDVSKSMSINDCGGQNRLECSLEGIRVLEESLGGLSDADLEVVPFASSLVQGIVDPDSFPTAESEGTDIAGALREAQIAFRYGNLRGIVLLTDGRVTRGMLTPVTIPGVPVYAVGVGDTLEEPDVSVEDIVFERINYVGTVASAEVTLAVPGFGDREITVRLLEGEKQLDRAAVTPGRGAAQVGVALRYVPDREGMKRLTIEVIPITGEESTENNREVFSVRVLRERIRILYIDELADWNFTFLRNLAKRSERMEIEAVTRKPDRGFVTVPGDAAFRFPSGPGELERYDLVIVSDDRKLLEDQRNVAALARYVERGGGLLLLADEHSPLTEPRISRQLERIFPVAAAGQPSVELGEYHVRVPTREAGHPLALAFGDLSEPPPLLGRIDGLEVTSAAEVPLVMSDRNGIYPFLALQRSGEGIAAVVLGFPVWRWRLAGSDVGNTYENFLGGLVQYLAEGGQAPALMVETSRTAYRSGERIAVTAYTRDDRSVERIRGEIYRLDEEDRLVQTFLFEPDMTRTGYARAAIGPLEPGDYRVTVAEIGDEGVGLEGQSEFSVLPVSAEFLKRSRDTVFLSHLASLSGGLVVELERIGTLPQLMDLEPVVRERKEIDDLRASPLLLIATLLLLTLEWVLRKLWGLV